MNLKILKVLAIFYALSCFSAYAMELIEVGPANAKFKVGVIENNLEKVQEALKEGADINLQFEVIIPADGPVGPFDSQYKKYYIDGRYKYYYGIDLAIFQAARMGHSEIVKYLFRSGAKTSTKVSDLLFAAWDNNFELFKFLFESYINMGMDIKVGHFEKSLYRAIDDVNLNAIQLLVYYGMDLNDNCYGRLITWWAGLAFDGVYPEYKEKAKEMVLFVKKHAERMKNLKNKNLKDMVQKVNDLLKSKIASEDVLPRALSDLVTNYALYPNDSEEFFKLSDQEIDEFIKIYCEEFENEETEKVNSEDLSVSGACSIM